jgi:hypothetical protein
MRGFSTEEGHRVLSVFGDVEIVRHFPGAKGLSREADITRVVLDQQDLDRATVEKHLLPPGRPGS